LAVTFEPLQPAEADPGSLMPHRLTAEHETAPCSSVPRLTGLPGTHARGVPGHCVESARDRFHLVNPGMEHSSIFNRRDGQQRPTRISLLPSIQNVSFIRRGSLTQVTRCAPNLSKSGSAWLISPRPALPTNTRRQDRKPQNTYCTSECIGRVNRQSLVSSKTRVGEKLYLPRLSWLQSHVPTEGAWDEPDASATSDSESRLCKRQLRGAGARAIFFLKPQHASGPGLPSFPACHRPPCSLDDDPFRTHDLVTGITHL